MGFWSKVFGKDDPRQTKKTTSASRKISAPAQSQTPRSTDSLDLPPEFDGKTSYRDMFKTRTPDRLRAMCHDLPIEALNLNRPGSSREMGRAITQVFAVSIYMATNEVPPEYGDIAFPRLVNQIAKYKGADLHLELCDLVRDFGIHLTSAGRYREAVRVLRVLKDSLFWRAWPQGDACLFVALSNIANETNLRSDFAAALEAAEHIPQSQKQDAPMNEGINRLKQKMEAL
jgi:hypothetical protein